MSNNIGKWSQPEKGSIKLIFVILSVSVEYPIQYIIRAKICSLPDQMYKSKGAK